MLKLLINRMVSRHGFIPLLLKIGDIAVKATRSRKDDKAWAKIKKVLKLL